MKWKDFIKKAKEAGVKDEDEIWYIDIGADWLDYNFRKDKKLGWAVS